MNNGIISDFIDNIAELMTVRRLPWRGGRGAEILIGLLLVIMRTGGFCAGCFIQVKLTTPISIDDATLNVTHWAVVRFCHLCESFCRF
ncbi:MAG: hypothetical protein ACFB2X_26370 [Rivularia sp. (in: cyanobacteria)]